MFICTLFYYSWTAVQEESDIIAGVICTSLLAVIFVVAVTSIINFFLIKRKLCLESSHSDPDLEALHSSLFTFKFTGYNTWPFLKLSSKLSLQYGRITTISKTIIFPQKNTGTLSNYIILPHRGNWELTKVNLYLTDLFGLIKISYVLKTPKYKYRAFPARPNGIIEPYPIITSRNREGDTSYNVDQKLGEYFDIKTYHPSDGLKKIIWKIYAKSGILISRHPETSMTPEGQVVIFVSACPHDDQLVQNVVEYFKTLDESNLQVYLGCSGMRDRPIATSAINCMNLLIDSTWDSEKSNNEIDNFIKQLGSKLSNLSSIEKIIFFVSSGQIVQSTNNNVYNSLDTLDKLGIKPVVFLLKENVNFINKNIQQSAQDSENYNYYNNFLKLISSRNWLLEERVL